MSLTEREKEIALECEWAAPIAGDNGDRLAASDEETSIEFATVALSNHAKRQKKPSSIKVGDTCNGP